MDKKVRLNKFIAESGVVSRRKADELISQGLVTINGKQASLGMTVNLGDEVAVDGKVIKQESNKVHYALNKPLGIISTASDEQGRKTVLDLVPAKPRVFPIGRLDASSEGLILLTNDGDFANTLIRPSFNVGKEYKVIVRKAIEIKDTDKIKTKFNNGLNIDGKKMTAAITSPIELSPNGKYLVFKVLLSTGYNRQIRKMCAKIGLEVTKLVRIRIGKLSLDSLAIKPGEFKNISPEDVI